MPDLMTLLRQAQASRHMETNGPETAAALRAVLAAVEAGASVQQLTASVRTLVSVCDLPCGYTDEHDPFAENALTMLAIHLDRLARMTPTLNALLVQRVNVSSRQKRG